MVCAGCASRFMLGATMALAVLTLARAGSVASGEHLKCAPEGSQPTQVNVTNDITRRYGEPEVAVNPQLRAFTHDERRKEWCSQLQEPGCGAWLQEYKRT